MSLLRSQSPLLEHCWDEPNKPNDIFVYSLGILVVVHTVDIASGGRDSKLPPIGTVTGQWHTGLMLYEVQVRQVHVSYIYPLSGPSLVGFQRRFWPGQSAPTWKRGGWGRSVSARAGGMVLRYDILEFIPL